MVTYEHKFRIRNVFLRHIPISLGDTIVTHPAFTTLLFGRGATANGRCNWHRPLWSFQLKWIQRRLGGSFDMKLSLFDRQDVCIWMAVATTMDKWLVCSMMIGFLLAALYFRLYHWHCIYVWTYILLVICIVFIDSLFHLKSCFDEPCLDPCLPVWQLAARLSNSLKP